MEQQVIDLIASILEVDADQIDTDTAVGDLPEWDSLHHLAIIKALEEAYDIKFAPADLAEAEDIADLIDLIKELTA